MLQRVLSSFCLICMSACLHILTCVEECTAVRRMCVRRNRRPGPSRRTDAVSPQSLPPTLVISSYVQVPSQPLLIVSCNLSGCLSCFFFPPHLVGQRTLGLKKKKKVLTSTKFRKGGLGSFHKIPSAAVGISELSGLIWVVSEPRI